MRSTGYSSSSTSSLPSRYRPTGSLGTSSGGSTFNYTPSTSSTGYTSTRLGSSQFSSRYSSALTSGNLGSSALTSGGNLGSSPYSTLNNPTTSSYLPSSSSATGSSSYGIDQSPYATASTGSYGIDQSPYAPKRQQSEELYSAYNTSASTVASNVYGSKSPYSPYNSPSTSAAPNSYGTSTSQKPTILPQQQQQNSTLYRESSPGISSNPKSKFLNRRNSSTDLIGGAGDRRNSNPGMDLAAVERLASAKKTEVSADPTSSVPSVRDSWASGYLRRRKEAQNEGRNTPEPGTSAPPAGVFAAKPIAAESITKVPVKEPPPTEALAVQNEFMQRLMSAHSVVDDLLSRRGLRGEDESKFLKHFEWVPVIQEEGEEISMSPRVARRRARASPPQAAPAARHSMSSESDSGLSMESTASESAEAEIDADGCDFECRGARDEICEFSVLMSGSDEAAELAVKPNTRVERKEDEIANQKTPESKSAKKLVRQKLEAEEVELKIPKVEVPKAEPKMARKVVRQELNSREDVELKVPRVEEELPIVAFSKCAVARCRPTIKNEEFTEIVKLRQVEKQPSKIEAFEAPKPEPKSTRRLVRQKLNAHEIELHTKLTIKEKAEEERHPKSEEVPKKVTTTKIPVEEPVTLAFSKCAVAKCRPKMTEGEVSTQRVKLKPPDAKPEDDKPIIAAVNPFDEVTLKKVVFTERPAEPKKSSDSLKKVAKLQFKPPGQGDDRKMEKPRRKLLRRQQTEPTLPSSTKKDVGRLEIDEKGRAEGGADSTRIIRPQRHLLDRALSLSSASRSMSARFRAAQEEEQSGRAEISVQHCSFYEVQRALAEPNEKCLRIHFRLTARQGCSSAQAQKTLPTNERKHRVFLRVSVRQNEIAADLAKSTESSPRSTPERKLPGKLKVEAPKPKEFSVPRPLIFTDTSVKILQERLKRQQKEAELQSIRGSLRRVPKEKTASELRKDDRNTAAKRTGEDAADSATKSRRKVKKIVVVKKKKRVDSGGGVADDVKDEHPKNGNVARQPSSTGDINPKTPDGATSRPPHAQASSPLAERSIHTHHAASITRCPSSSSSLTSSRGSRRHKKARFYDEWERRLVDEFRRHLHIPILEAIYRQIFCLRCRLCPLLEAPRAPPRAHFVRRHAPHHPRLADMATSELLRLLAIFRPAISTINYKNESAYRRNFTYSSSSDPFGVSLRRVNRRQRRPWIPVAQRKPKTWVPRWRQRGEGFGSGEEEIDEEEEEEPVTEAAAPPAEPAADADDGATEAGDEEVDENAAPQDEEPAEEERKQRRAAVQEAEPDPATLTEAEQAMLAAKKRQAQEAELKAMDAESRRKAELLRIEEELVLLKERQIERRKQREIEEAEEADRRRKEEEAHRREAEQRKLRMEAEKMKRTEEKVKRNQQLAGSFAGGVITEGGRNFTVNASGEKKEIGKKEIGKKGTGMTKEQKDEAKRNFMSIVARPVDVSNLLPNDIKAKIKQVYAKIVKLEGEKYDLEKRHDRQEYDLKELLQREQQAARNKALKAGIDPVEVEDTNRPPKVTVFSKFDRQVDRRSYGDKRELFENPAQKLPPSIVHGSGRPPPEWGRKELEELEQLRKNLEPPKYQELVKVEGAKPPVEVVPMQIPTEEFDPSLEREPSRGLLQAFAIEHAAHGKRSAPAQNGTLESSGGGDDMDGGQTELEIVEEPVTAGGDDEEEEEEE